MGALGQAGRKSITSAQKIHDVTYSARNFNTSPLTISGLEGDKYDYTVEITYKPASSVANALRFQLNADSSANYREYYMRGSVGTGYANVNDATNCELGFAYNSAVTSFLRCKITGSSGSERKVFNFNSGHNSVSNSTFREVRVTDVYWKNTVDELTSLVFTTSGSTNADARIIVYATPKESAQEGWELIATASGTGLDLSTTPLEVSSTIDGDTEKEYKLEITATTTGNCRMGLLFNSDNAANYLCQYLRNDSGSIGAQNATKNMTEFSANTVSSGDVSATVLISSESGKKRIARVYWSCNASSSRQSQAVAWWSNTVDNLTSIKLTNNFTTSVNNVEMRLYRKRPFMENPSILAYELVEEVALSSTDLNTSPHTFSGLSGDSAELYKVVLDTDSAGANTEIKIQLNADSGTNYLYQTLRSSGGAATAFNNGAFTGICRLFIHTGVSRNEVIIYPKSGEERLALSTDAYAESVIEFQSGWWTNTADELTSLKVIADNTTGITGTLKLYKLQERI